jgi:hypothetical protein
MPSGSRNSFPDPVTSTIRARFIVRDHGWGPIPELGGCLAVDATLRYISSFFRSICPLAATLEA